MAESEGSNGVQFFEGVEKLLEIWFTRSDGNTKQCDLRNIPRQKLESLLKIVRCEVISFVCNDQVDAYVLSESSMFVARRRFILKTCGTTTPLQCLKPLMMLVEQYAGFDEVEDVFYSRKNFKRPDLQMNPHQAFEQEVALLDTFFKDGAAYCLGTVNRDCWYLYTLNPLEGENMKRHQGIPEPDQTLEILMSDLDPEVMNIFTRDESSSAAEATQGCYMTIHITPEPDFSYVSFESNVPQASYKDVISRVLETFQPGKFVITVFANKASPSAECPRELEKQTSFGDWLRHDIQYCRFKNYDLTYAFYSKFPS
ncbi:S-adenosylmethionine decarboxylase proenzyme [Blattella germanica]|nr:S-adenosylmethionine decarboxylase proenzyme [Blattella germanica]